LGPVSFLSNQLHDARSSMMHAWMRVYNLGSCNSAESSFQSSSYYQIVMLMNMLSIFLGLSVLAQVVGGQSTCIQPRARKSWQVFTCSGRCKWRGWMSKVVLLIASMFRRALSDSEKSNYIEAVKCLQNSEPQGTKWFPNKSRYDDFVSVHINATGAALFDASGSMLLLDSIMNASLI
jgi:hypothetical protein